MRTPPITFVSTGVETNARRYGVQTSGLPVSPPSAVPPLLGELPRVVVQAWRELGAQYGTGPSVDDAELLPTMEATMVSSGLLAPGKVFTDLDLPVEGQGVVSPSAE